MEQASTSTRKLERLEELGCAHTIEGADPDKLTREVRAIGRPDAVVNHLGGEFTQAGLEVMERGGTMVICGRTAAPTSEFKLAPFFLRHEEIVGSTMGTQPELATLVELLAERLRALPAVLTGATGLVGAEQHPVAR